MPALHFPHLLSIPLRGGPHYFLHRPKLACILNGKIFQCSNLDQ